jgi:hypothetical protein
MTSSSIYLYVYRPEYLRVLPTYTNLIIMIVFKDFINYKISRYRICVVIYHSIFFSKKKTNYTTKTKMTNAINKFHASVTYSYGPNEMKAFE